MEKRISAKTTKKMLDFFVVKKDKNGNEEKDTNTGELKYEKKTEMSDVIEPEEQVDNSKVLSMHFNGTDFVYLLKE